MKKTEQQLADELDIFLTAMLNGELPPEEAPGLEAQLAAQLMQLAEETIPDAEFDRGMKKYLEIAARQKSTQKKAGAPERPSAQAMSFWQQFIQTLKEGLIMRRTAYALGGLAALALIFVIAYVAFFNRDDSPGTVADNGTVVETVDNGSQDAAEEPIEVADLPLLPGLQDGGPRGLGGGGAAMAESTNAEPVVADMSIMPIFTDIFSGTEFVLNAPLPERVRSAGVLMREPATSVDIDTARRYADAFGFSGPLYTQPLPEFEDGFTPPVTYFAFDGTRMLNMDAYGVYYSDQSVSFDNMERLPFEQISAQAEAFLQERGLLDFDYEISRGWMNDVFVYRVIDGRTVNQPEITVSFNDEGQIMFVNVQTLRNLQQLGNYPLRSAEEAWAIVQDGVMKNNLLYNYLPVYDDAAVGVSEPAVWPTEEYRFWPREYEAGDTAHIYSWPNVFLAVDGSAPRVTVNQYMLTGDAETLQAIADDSFSMYHIWGVIGADGKTLQVEGYEKLAENHEALFLQGSVQREGDQTLFTDDASGDAYIIPDAPADLPTDERLNLFGWATRDIGAEYPVIDWESLDIYIDYSEPEMMPEPMPGYPIDEPVPFEPMTYEQFTVNSVELVYAYTYRFPEVPEGEIMLRYEPPTIILQPAWKFSGEADNGDLIEIFVEAVSPEFIEPSESE